MSTGVRFPTESSTAFARDVVTAALSAADPVGARTAHDDTVWRRGYLNHFVRLVEAGLDDPHDAVAIARAGLQAAHASALYGETPLDEAFSQTPPTSLTTHTVGGSAAPEADFSLPYRGERLRGKALADQLEAWVERGVITQSCASAVTTVAANPDWLSLEGDTIVVLGGGAEMGPARSLLRWGARVALVDLPRPDIWSRIQKTAEAGAGSAVMPQRPDGTFGADLLHELPALGPWLASLEGRLVLGNYCYADGSTHVRLSLAADALGQHVMTTRPDTALAFLATPTDVFAVPDEEVAFANAAYRRGSKVLRTPFRVLSGGRLLHRNYPPQPSIGVCDALVPQQGPNYALAKRLQRWRATVAIADGSVASLNVAPATKTQSVIKNKALAMAYAGAHRFGVEVFEPATSNVLMAALLVHDLRAGREPAAVPWQEEAHGAAHGGLWTAAYHPRSALGLAAVLGVSALRS